MPGYRTARIREDLKREITDILRIIKDPRVKNQILTVLSVVITNDLSYLKVYISSMDGLNGAKIAAKCLNSAKGLIKKEIGLRLKLRKIPDVEFFADNSIEESIDMFKKIEN